MLQMAESAYLGEPVMGLIVLFKGLEQGTREESGAMRQSK